MENVVKAGQEQTHLVMCTWKQERRKQACQRKQFKRERETDRDRQRQRQTEGKKQVETHRYS